MQNVQSSYGLWAIVAVLIVGLYTIDLQPRQASVVSKPEFSSSAETKTSETPPSKTITELNNAMVDIADKAKSTVVTVSVTKTVEAQQNPLSRFFGDPRQQPEEYQRRGQGSGVIVSDEGYILTNNHVVEGASDVEVQLFNDKQYDAEIVGTDPLTDIAVLKIDTKNLNVIKLGKSEQLRVGEMVMAIGSPLQSNLAHSVSMGIVSAKGRSIGIIQQEGFPGYENFIQTDAAINPGNSGGALVNMEGELIGINTAIASRSGGSDGIGFAVPIDIAQNVMKSIIENGRVVRGYLGIQMDGEVDNSMAKALGLDEAYGIIVGSVPEDGPAAEAGLQSEDIIQTINGDPVRSWASLRTIIGTSTPGTEVELGIVRNGEKQTVTVTLGEQPEDMAVAAQPNQSSGPDMEEQLGFRVQDLNADIARELGLEPNQQGVIVAQISQSSNAYRQGLRRGSVITEVDRQEVTDVGDFNRLMGNLIEEGKEVALLRVINGQSSQLMAFELN